MSVLEVGQTVPVEVDVVLDELTRGFGEFLDHGGERVLAVSEISG